MVIEQSIIVNDRKEIKWWTNFISEYIDGYHSSGMNWQNYFNSKLPPSIKLIDLEDLLICESEEDLTAFILKWS